MRLEEGEIITLNDDGKDYVVVKEVEFNNKNYYYLMSAKKPVKILIVEFKVQDGREVIVGYLRYDDTNDFRQGNTAVTQSLSYHVRIEMMLLSIGLNLLALLLADAWTVFQRPRHGCHRDSQLSGNVFHCDDTTFVHRHS